MMRVLFEFVSSFFLQRWNKFNVALPQWSWVGQINPSPFTGTDRYLLNLCAGAPAWYCNFTSYASGGLGKDVYALGGGLLSLNPPSDPLVNPTDTYVRVELTWTSLAPALTGGTVTCNYHIILPNYMTDLGKYPVRLG
jgi:hypothetical protein